MLVELSPAQPAITSPSTSEGLPDYTAQIVDYLEQNDHDVRAFLAGETKRSLVQGLSRYLGVDMTEAQTLLEQLQAEYSAQMAGGSAGVSIEPDRAELFSRLTALTTAPVASQSMTADWAAPPPPPPPAALPSPLPTQEEVVTTSTPFPVPIKACQRAIESLMANRHGQFFRAPVDWEALEIPDYPQIVKVPMDLGTVHSRLGSEHYESFEAFESDVQLVWDNAKLFNDPESDVYEAATQLEDIWARKLSHLKKSSAKMQKAAAEKTAAPSQNKSSAKRPLPVPRKEPSAKKTKGRSDRRDRGANGKRGSVMPPMGQDDYDMMGEEVSSEYQAAFANRQASLDELRIVQSSSTPIPLPAPVPAMIPMKEDHLSLKARELEIERLRLKCNEAEIQAKFELSKKMLEHGIPPTVIAETLVHLFPGL